MTNIVTIFIKLCIIIYKYTINYIYKITQRNIIMHYLLYFSSNKNYKNVY